ncbi:MAG: hypothetical protein VX589_02365 [Myxococcota bacterium]|nr:hypothetical protein [Myxococcota bacterium]
MSKKKSKKNTRRKSSARTSQPPPRRRRDGKEAIRGMMYGGLIFAALAVVFFVRIGEKTPFNHLVDTLTPAETEKSSRASDGDAKRVKAAKKKNVKNQTPTPRSARRMTPKPITTNATKAPPLETTTDREKEDLDKLLEQKSR